MPYSNYFSSQNLQFYVSASIFQISQPFAFVCVCFSFRSYRNDFRIVEQYAATTVHKGPTFGSLIINLESLRLLEVQDEDEHAPLRIWPAILQG